MYTNRHKEIFPNDQQKHAYKALQKAAEKIGNNNYLKQKEEWLKTHKNMNKFKFTITAEHEEIIQAMPKVLNGELSPEQAMSLLWQYETMKQRLGN